MKKRFLAALALPIILAACAASNEDTSVVAKSDIVTHNWILTKVDNKAIELPEPFKAPTLELNQDMAANGHSGCNRYFGQAELKDGKLRIEKMGMTMMACPEPAMEMERVMSGTLMEWSDATVLGNELTLTNTNHTLTFKRSDVK
ncbi:META domain-containing protein [Photobacterium sp. SDRW27]|uniref:META domain-containing protein n=1 Tax=Photobacterium obscurum TaxID=2829490 RepID=UPI0022433F28|nr:META domain-containing protein [Photobacterium obscurum]MCW8329707.1 META domain-containing protein [Photobacterium obscurum]